MASMRFFPALVYVFLALNLSVFAQQHVSPTNPLPTQSQDMNLDGYTKALAHFGYSKSGFNASQFISQADVTALINLANLDPSLAKAPNVKAQTINVFRDLESLLNIERNFGQKFQELQKKQQSAQNFSSSTSSNSRKPPGQNKYFQVQDEINKLQTDSSKQQGVIKDSIKKRIVGLIAIENTSEGQQFSMPRDSKLYASLQSPTLPGLGDRPQAVSSTPFEVASSIPEGFFAYRMRVKNGPDGASLKDSESNYILEADRAKTVFVSGYTKPVSLGESLRLKVQMNGQKVINGKPYTEYVVVEEQ